MYAPSRVRGTIRSSTEASYRPPCIRPGFITRYMPGLGGFRHARPDSLNPGWHNASFRGFADYMQMPEFWKNLDDLIRLAKSERIAIMYAEAVRRPALSEARGDIPFHSNIGKKRSMIGYSKVGNGSEDQKKTN